MKKTTRDFEVKCFMTNQDYRLRAAAFLDEAQDMALQGSDELGFGYDKMNACHLGWVLYRMYMKFLRPVIWRDRVTMNTWHKGMEGLVFLRDFELLANDGQRSAVATSSWVVLDMDKRSFVKKEDFPDFINTDPQCTEPAVEFAAPKVVIPSGITRTGFIPRGTSWIISFALFVMNPPDEAKYGFSSSTSNAAMFIILKASLPIYFTLGPMCISSIVGVSTEWLNKS